MGNVVIPTMIITKRKAIMVFEICKPTYASTPPIPPTSSTLNL